MFKNRRNLSEYKWLIGKAYGETGAPDDLLRPFRAFSGWIIEHRPRMSNTD